MHSFFKRNDLLAVFSALLLVLFVFSISSAQAVRNPVLEWFTQTG